MAVFNFKFESVLTHRRRTEDQRQRELAQLLRQKMILEEQLRSLQQRITEDKNTMTDALSGHVNVSRIRQHATHSMQSTARAQQIAVKLLAMHRQIEQSRVTLLEATKSRKAIELLRERHYHRWCREQDRREVAELDEIATQTHGRRINHTMHSRSANVNR
ncbi:flagellar export protein FliJ [Planctomycetales bacterium ZRK34]|nr:flagellar export protein FliJ [Planctomycetales bacterium ZRK34]